MGRRFGDLNYFEKDYFILKVVFFFFFRSIEVALVRSEVPPSLSP